MQSQMGAVGLGASQQAVHKGIEALSPDAVILVGIAFGVDSSKQSIGDVLVARRLMLYEPQRVGTGKAKARMTPRGARADASPWLVDRCQNASLHWDNTNCKVWSGLVLSGEKLVDNLAFRGQLLKLEPEAIGGEMEGAGLYTACQDAKVDWILVKAISDWADGHKDAGREEQQQRAAHNAASFILHMLKQAPLKRSQKGLPLPGWMKAFIALIVVAAVLIQLWKGDVRSTAIAVLAIVFGGAWLVCLYVAIGRTAALVVTGKGTPKHPRWQRWALVGAAAIPLLILSGLGYRHIKAPRIPKVVLLIATFDGPDPQKYRVTETVLARLRAALAPHNDVKVEALGRAITEEEGSTVARTEGQARKATIVIWGWYGATAEVVPLSMHFEILRPPEYMPQLGPETSGQLRMAPLAELDGFVLQPRLSAEMSYLSLFTVGMIRYAAYDWDGAIISFSDALRETPGSVRALDESSVLFFRGNAYFSKGDYDHAIADYDRAIGLESGRAELYSNRGAVYIAKRDYDLAIADYDRAIELEPERAELYSNRSVAYYNDGDYDRTIADFDQAIQLRPDDATTYYNRASTHVDKGDYDRAIADYDRAIQLRPSYFEAYCNRGETYGAKNDYDRAIADLDQAIRLQPDSAVPYVNRGNAYDLKGDHDRAILDYDRAIALAPNLAPAYLNRGMAYRAKGIKDMAMADFQKALDLSDDPNVRWLAEWQLKELGAN